MKEHSQYFDCDTITNDFALQRADITRKATQPPCSATQDFAVDRAGHQIEAESADGAT